MKDALGHGSAGSGIHSQGTKATPQLQRRHFEAIAADLKAKGATGGDYRNKGPGNNPAAVARVAAKFSSGPKVVGNTLQVGGKTVGRLHKTGSPAWR